MRSLIVLLLIASATSVAADPNVTVDPNSDLVAPPPRAAPAPGPVPGMPSLTVTVKKDATRCGGHAILVTAKRGKPAPADADFIAAMTIDSPRGLDFDRDHEAASARSTKRFNDFIEDSTRKMGTARDRYTKAFADAGTNAAAQVVAAARITQLDRRFADVLTSIEIPVNVRASGFAEEAGNEFCNAMAERAQPLDARADQDAQKCRELAASGQVGAGWWDAVCARPQAPEAP